jgi:hypothetical protein
MSFQDYCSTDHVYFNEYKPFVPNAALTLYTEFSTEARYRIQHRRFVLIQYGPFALNVGPSIPNSVLILGIEFSTDGLY